MFPRWAWPMAQRVSRISETSSGLARRKRLERASGVTGPLSDEVAEATLFLHAGAWLAERRGSTPPTSRKSAGLHRGERETPPDSVRNLMALYHNLSR